MDTKTACPYCRQVLTKPPKRKAACPICGQFIYVDQGELITEDESKTRHWVGDLERLVISRQDFDREREELSASVGGLASVEDTVNSICNQIIASQASYIIKHWACMELARLASFRNQPVKPLIAEALRMSLLDLKAQGAREVVVRGYMWIEAYSTCDACKAVQGKIYPIDQAIKELPVPTVCTSDWCRCSYVRACAGR